MICWPPFWHELVRTLGRGNLYVVAARIVQDSAPFFFHHLKVVHQFLFHSYLFNSVFSMLFHHRCNRIWTNGGNQQLWWRTRDVQLSSAVSNSLSPKTALNQDRTAECPICFETLWTATPTAFVKLVEGQLPHVMLKTHSMRLISPQLMLCLAKKCSTESEIKKDSSV